jgi:hypothetical protein
MIEDLQPAIARLKAVADRARLPEVEEGTWFGTPCLKVRGKSFVRVKDADTFVVPCPIEEKEMLMAAAPDIYSEADHYRGWPAMLVRIAALDDAALGNHVVQAWRQKAPRRLVAAYDAGRG